MAYGISLLMRHIDRDKPIVPRETRDRDRTLSGKARIKARRGRKW